MDKDWIKAVMQLCVVAANDAESMESVMRYIEIMEREYGLDRDSFQKVYDYWYRTGEIREEYRRGYQKTLPLYHRGLEGMCRLLGEGLLSEKMFFEVFWEIPYEILKRKGEYTGYYPFLPGCIGFADTRDALEHKMQAALKKWIRQAFYMWHENYILEE